MERRANVRRRSSESLEETIHRYELRRQTKSGGSSPQSPLSQEPSITEAGTLVLTFGREVVRLNYARDLQIVEEDLDNELKKQPALYTFYARILAMQKALVDSAKNELREYEGRLYTLLKFRLQERDGKKPTQADIEGEMSRDVQLRDKRRRLVELQLQLDVLWSIRDSLAQKKDCLMTLAANKRAEWSTDLYLRRNTR